ANSNPRLPSGSPTIAKCNGCLVKIHEEPMPVNLAALPRWFLAQTAARVDLNPANAENARGTMARIMRLYSIHIAVENPKGSTRAGKDAEFAPLIKSPLLWQLWPLLARHCHARYRP